MTRGMPAVRSTRRALDISPDAFGLAGEPLAVS